MEAIAAEHQVVPAELKENYFGIEWLSSEELIVDTNYQRPVKHALVKTITREGWDWRAVRTLAVSLRKTDEGNLYAVIDGQQRLTAARECDIKQLPCQVYIDLTERQEAELFLKLNNSSKPTANDMFRAKLAEGDEQAKIIMIAVRNTNWELDLDNTSRGKGRNSNWCTTTVNSANALIGIYQGGGVLHLQSVLNLAHGWYGQHLAGSFNILVGLHSFLTRHKGKIDMSRLTAKLAEETPSGLLGKANQISAAERSLGNNAGTEWRALTRVFVSLYNKGLRNGKLEE